MIRILLFLLILLSVYQLTAQNNNFSTYYNQRLTLFKSLPDTPDEIIMLGNSITDGCEWSELFQNPRIKNRGINGDTTEGILYRLDEVTSSKPKKVFLLIGINDLGKGISTDIVYENICTITRKIKIASPETKVYIQSILPVNPSFSNFPSHSKKTTEILFINTKLKTWCRVNEFNFVDLFHSFTEPDSEYLNPYYSNDGLHLTGAGYLMWAKIIFPLTKPEQ